MMRKILTALDTGDFATPVADAEAKQLGAELSELSGASVYPRSLAMDKNSLFFLARKDGAKLLGLLRASPTAEDQFAGESRAIHLADKEVRLTWCPADASNAAALRVAFPFLVPRTLGIHKSVGCGDRLGLATPGHIRALRSGRMAPILAQQSIRENARTGRTPQNVMDDALWGVFQEGWRQGFGADADHLKTHEDIDVCAAAGYTFYTIDPGEHVDNEAHSAPAGALREKVEALPWRELEIEWRDLKQELCSRPTDLGDFRLTLSEEDLLRAAAKYGRVIAHTVNMYRHLDEVMNGRAFELEMSVDETETVTTLAEHVYIAHELKRLGVRWVSLAPRYVGTFEKGVDYLGNLGDFERSFAEHLAVANTFGPYKLSLHSGSDKFSIYPIAASLAGELVHLKTAGTSYLEALRAVAQANPALFRRIAEFAISRYPVDRATYHVSAEEGKMPDVRTLKDDELTTLLDDFHAREVLHVTFGSVLHHPQFRGPFFETLRSHEEVYYQVLESHFVKHLSPFSAVSATSFALGP